MLGLPAKISTISKSTPTNENYIQLYCCYGLLRFDHFQKPFDSIWRNGLLLKLLDNKIACKFYRFISDMYSR